jgi:bifunctional non-homologous end joining protein LigD
MLPITAGAPFDEGWLFEVKWDGCAIADQHQMCGYSRRTCRWARFLRLSKRCGPRQSAVLDGEIWCWMGGGRTQPSRTTRRTAGKLVYYLFDLLYLDQYDLRLRLRPEGAAAATAARSQHPLHDHVCGGGMDAFEVRQHGVEESWPGRDSPASPYRVLAEDQIVRRQEPVIASFTAAAGAPASHWC